MIVRIVLLLFISAASGICYLAGMTRLMSSLLIGFAVMVSTFFGILFVVPESRELWFPVYGEGASWPFFLLALILIVIIGLLLRGKERKIREEQVTADHYKYFIGAFLANILSVYLPSLLWFPSDEKRESLDASSLGLYVLSGTCLYLLGTIISLYLFYLASKGTAEKYPDLMRRIVLAVFSGFHFDKMPAFVAFLLIYSPETRIIYPTFAALALAAYIPVAVFLLILSWQSEKIE